MVSSSHRDQFIRYLHFLCQLPDLKLPTELALVLILLQFLFLILLPSTLMNRWVVKVGSQMVFKGGLPLLIDWMRQVVILKETHNIEMIWVTSGAIASGVQKTAFSKTKNDWSLAEKQALSAIGQPILMDNYNIALKSANLQGAQVLLTYDDISNRSRRLNLQQTIAQLISWKILPILNENDAVATEEIKFGDNDSLSAKVAVLMKASRLIILTDVEGLFDKDPSHSKARLIENIDAITPKVFSLATAKGSRHGTGGMYSKLKAAKEASESGIETLLVKGDAPSILLEIVRGSWCGTRVAPKKKGKR